MLAKRILRQRFPFSLGIALLFSLSLEISCGSKSETADEKSNSAATPPQKSSDEAEPGKNGDDDSDVATNLQVLPKDWTKSQVKTFMREEIKRGLGVSCRFCHDKSNFASDENPHKDMARKMMIMTNKMNKDFFDGNKEVSCFTCHNGKKEPEE